MREIIVRYNDGNDHMAVRGGEYIQDLVRCKDCKKHGTSACSLWDGMTTEDYMWCCYGEERDERER